MEIYNHHKRLFTIALVFFLALTFFAAIIPAYQAQENNAPLPNSKPLTEQETLGKAIFVKEGCIACHTQQVRNVDMDKVWGDRPSIAADYAGNTRTDIWRNTANLLGSERTGPDLTNIGIRQPGKDWHLLHLYNPRSVSTGSIMPAYPWLFEVKENSNKNDIKVMVPNEFRQGIVGDIVATPEAMQLVAYLQSLKQTKLPDGKPVPIFLYPKPESKALAGSNNGSVELDGKSLYAVNCQSCHQENGEGLKGAFPSLKGSQIVLNDDPKTLTTIIMKGYNGRVSEGYGLMPAVGSNNNLKPDEVAAIMNHERNSWGNKARKVDPAEIKKIIDLIGK
ncbi:MAG: cytochrome c [Bacteroidetes bacterium]|nr:cytochrome c [Bacteroidota bacterium]MBU1373285.1 cytochrome c [Bacteroidota bacterium]MBU1484223.1 cytochrome c [Bacteroidota bacterium]MBU1760805.1 cytochrome c [Bacteroidota bacterium]MBU2268359.1 cytochrome c [Bacteroidota bacterium]